MHSWRVLTESFTEFLQNTRHKSHKKKSALQVTLYNVKFGQICSKTKTPLQLSHRLQDGIFRKSKPTTIFTEEKLVESWGPWAIFVENFMRVKSKHEMKGMKLVFVSSINNFINIFTLTDLIVWFYENVPIKFYIILLTFLKSNPRFKSSIKPGLDSCFSVGESRENVWILEEFHVIFRTINSGKLITQIFLNKNLSLWTRYQNLIYFRSNMYLVE